MLRTIEIILGLPDGHKANQSMGSILHGALMEIVAPKQAMLLHEDGLRPYSQYLYYDKVRQASRWRVTALNSEADGSILEPLMQYDKPLFLKQKGYALTCIDKKVVRESSYEVLADKIFTSSEACRGARLDFMTAVSFKSGGSYVLYPEVYLIYQNLLQRWNAFSDGLVLDDADTFRHLAENTAVSQYNLQMRQFFVGQGRIPSFRGQLELRLYGNETLKKIGALLLEFSNFAGVGIKTALGMGGTKTVLLAGKEQSKP